MSRSPLFAAAALGLLCTATSHAGDLNIGVVLSGELTPGVYGRVMLSSGRPPPPLVYAQPVIVQAVPYGPPPPPVYLYVPPGHARHWAQHCREYHACHRPVYFVRGAEYEPGYRGPGHYTGRDRDYHDRGRHGHDRHDD